MASNDVKTGPGRPRDPTIEEKVLGAVLELLGERGYQGLTIEQVARRSGITKPTIYARWTTKGELVVAALVKSVPPLQPIEGADPTKRLIGFVAGFLVSFSHWVGGRTVLALHAQATHEPDLVEALVRDYWGPRAEALNEVLAEARAAGVIASSCGNDVARDLLFGPPIYRWLVTGEPLTHHGVRRSVTVALTGLAQAGAPQPPRP